MGNIIDSIPQRYFCARSARGTFESCNTVYDVQVNLPSLTELHKSAWADWGPMCTCRLSPDQAVSITYRDTITGESATYRIAPAEIALHSPMSADERRRLPFYVEVLDVARGVRLRTYLDQDGQVDRLELELAHTLVKFSDLVFQERRCAEIRSTRADTEVRAG